MDKKQNLLGMNPSTASHRLVKDLLWKLIVETHRDTCHQCGKSMTRETFSIEHIKPWMLSENPVESYFDLENISFSHMSCNYAAATRPKVYTNKQEKKKAEWNRYYEKNSAQILERKRKRYQSVSQK